MLSEEIMMILSQIIRSDPPSVNYDGLTFQVSESSFFKRIIIFYQNGLYS